MTATMTNSVNGQIRHETLYVEKTVLLDEKDLKGTKVVTSALENQVEIHFELTAQARKRFAEVTRKNSKTCCIQVKLWQPRWIS